MVYHWAHLGKKGERRAEEGEKRRERENHRKKDEPHIPLELMLCHKTMTSPPLQGQVLLTTLKHGLLLVGLTITKLQVLPEPYLRQQLFQELLVDEINFTAPAMALSQPKLV